MIITSNTLEAFLSSNLLNVRLRPGGLNLLVVRCPHAPHCPAHVFAACQFGPRRITPTWPHSNHSPIPTRADTTGPGLRDGPFALSSSRPQLRRAALFSTTASSNAGLFPV